MRSYPQPRSPYAGYRFLIDVALLAIVVYIIYLFVNGRLTSSFSAALSDQQRIVQMYNDRTDFNADVGAIRMYRNELNYTPSGGRHDELLNNLSDAQARCRSAVSGYDDLARHFTPEYLRSQNIPLELDFNQCS